MSLVDDLKAYATSVASAGALSQAAAMAPAIKRQAIMAAVKAIAPYALGALAINIAAALAWRRRR